MLYNNPVAYKTDFLPQQIAELGARASQPARGQGVEHRRAARHRDPRAARRPARRCWSASTTPSSRRSTPARSAGSPDWSMRSRWNRWRCFATRCEGERRRRFALYRWFLPLLRMDTVPKFVQLIKLVQQRVGMGSDRVRPPRLPLEGEELRQAMAAIDAALATRPRTEGVTHAQSHARALAGCLKRRKVRHAKRLPLSIPGGRRHRKPASAC